MTATAKAAARPMDEAAVREIVAQVAAREIDPHTGLSAAELGFVREVTMEDGKIVIGVLPTHECVSMDLLTMNLECSVEEAHSLPRMRILFSSVWTPDMVPEAGKAKLCRKAMRGKAAFVCAGCGRPLDFMCG